jgi:hypothetical protein
VQIEVKRRIVCAFVKRGLLDSIDGDVMLLERHGGGFSVDLNVCIDGDDSARGLARLLRNCARPPFSMERRQLAVSLLDLSQTRAKFNAQRLVKIHIFHHSPASKVIAVKELNFNNGLGGRLLRQNF